MKILHIGKYAPPFFGGIENFMMDLADGCVAQGHEVGAIVHHHQTGQAYQQLELNGVKIYRVPSYGQLMFAPISPAFGYYLKRVINTFKPDVLHIHMPNTSAFFALLSHAARAIPWVVHWHSDVLGDDSPWFLKTFYPAYQPFERLVLARSAKIIATSAPYLASSRALQPYKDKTAVINLGLAGGAQAQVTQSRTGLELLVVGRLTYYKGHRYLIAALGELKSRGITDIRLNIVGGGELQAKLAQQIEQLGLSAQVKLLGKVTQAQLLEQFKAADVLCLPSIERTEAFGVVLMEAASFGLPAIVTDVPGSGMSWVVVDGQTGLVTKRRDAKALAGTILRLYQQPQWRQQLGEQALLRFKQCFSIEQVAKSTIGLYQSVA